MTPGQWVLLVGVSAAVGAAGVLIGAAVMDRSLRRETDAVLEVLGDGAWWYGLDIVHAGAGRVQRGSVYVALHALERRGAVISREVPDSGTPARGGIPRRQYRLACSHRAVQ